MQRKSLPATLKEEIALEGLDGVTLKTLWLRLEEQSFQPTEKLKDCSWIYIVRGVSNSLFACFELNEPRREAPPDENALLESSAKLASLPPLSTKIIDKDGVRGLCDTYGTRTELVMDAIRVLSRAAVEERYGNRFVVVANQSLRESILLPDHIDIPDSTPVTAIEYAILERCGQARTNGRPCSGPQSLLDIIPDPRSLFHCKKKLRGKDLLIDELRYPANSNRGVYRLFLPRMYRAQKRSADELLDYIEQLIREEGNENGYLQHSKLMRRLRAHPMFKTRKFKNLFKTTEFTNRFDLKKVPFRKLYPEATPNSYLNSGDGLERRLQSIRSKATPAATDQTMGKVESDKEDDKADTLLNISGQLQGKSGIYQVVQALEAAGPQGLSLIGLAQALGFKKLITRSFVKILIKKKLVEEYIMHENSSRYIMFVLKHLAQRNRDQLESLQTEIRTKVEEAKNETKSDAAAVAAAASGAEETTPEDTAITYSLMDTNSGKQTTVKVKRTYLKEYNTLDWDTCVDRSGRMSLMTLKRIKIIHEEVLRRGIMDGVTDLTKIVIATTNSKGVCRKTIFRVLAALAHRGAVDLYEVTFTQGDIVKTSTIMCDPKLYTLHDDNLRAFTEDLHNQKFMTYSQSRCRSTAIASSEKKSFKKSLIAESTLTNSRRFIKMKLLHEFLHYVTYECSARPIPAANIPADAWKLTASRVKALPTAYSTTLNWKTFVGPYEPAAGAARRRVGWIKMQEIADRMPLLVLYELYQFKHPLFLKYLEDPVRRYFPMAALGSGNLKKLQYYPPLLRLAIQMNCAGLVRIGPFMDGSYTERMQTQVFVNKNITLLDTTTSGFGITIEDKQYRRIAFRLDSEALREHFWAECRRICLNTFLQRKNNALASQTVGVFANIELDQGEALDDGMLPGDGKGAAGFHSGLGAHLFSQWSESNLTNTPHPTMDRVRAKTAANRSKFSFTRKRLMTAARIKANSHIRAESTTAVAVKRRARARWTPAEDTALLWAKLGGMYLGYTVSSVLYRDVVHWRCLTLEKSQADCIRRVKRLMNSIITKEMMKNCLTELKSNALVEKRFGPSFLNKLRKVYTTDLELKGALKIHHLDLISILSIIYAKITTCSVSKRNSTNLPDSTLAFWRRYVRTNAIERPHTTDSTEHDIQVNTVYNVIHSALCCNQDRVPYNLLLLDICKGYADEVLKAAIDRLRQIALISGTQHIQNMKDRSYQLSCVYGQQLQVNADYAVLRMVWQWLRYPESNMESINAGFAFYLVGQLMSGAVSLNIDLLNNDDETKASTDSVVTVPKLQAKKQVSIADKEPEIIQVHYEPIETLLKVSPALYHVLCYLNWWAGQETTAPIEPPQIQVVDQKCNFDCTVENKDLFEQYEEIIANADIRSCRSELEAILVTLLQQGDQDAMSNRKDFGKLTCTYARINAGNMISLLDNFNKLTFDPLKEVSVKIVENSTTAVKEIAPLEISKKMHNWSVYGRPDEDLSSIFSGRDRALVDVLLNKVKLKKEAGAKAAELKSQNITTVATLERLLVTLIDRKYVWICGSVEIQFVHYEFMDKWLISCDHVAVTAQDNIASNGAADSSSNGRGKRPAPSPNRASSRAKVAKLSEDDAIAAALKQPATQSIRLRPYPWIRITGTVNQRVVDRWVGTILLHLQNETGVRVSDLAERFHMLQPVQLKVLLRTLQDHSLITVTKLTKCQRLGGKVMLWSTYENPTIVAGSLLLDAADRLIVEAAASSLTDYCRRMGEKHYKNSFV